MTRIYSKSFLRLKVSKQLSANKQHTHVHSGSHTPKEANTALVRQNRGFSRNVLWVGSIPRGGGEGGGRQKGSCKKP